MVALVLFLYIFGTFSPSILLTAIPAYLEAFGVARFFPFRTTTFLFVSLPLSMMALVHQVPLLVFLFIAAVRKMRHERAFLYSKPLAVGFYAVIAVITLGDVTGLALPNWMPQGVTVVSAVYLLAAAGILLTLTVTPGAGDFANGVRRARKLGLRTAPLWSDLSANWAPVLAFTAILVVTILVTALVSLGAGGPGLLLPGIPTPSVQPPRAAGWTAPNIGAALVGACVVLYFGSAKQAFDLMYRKNSGPYFLLLLFFLWIVPLLMAFVVGVSGLDEAVQAAVGGVSPIMGITFAGSLGESEATQGGAMTAIGTSLMLAIIFLQLRLQAERRATELAAKGREG